MSDMKPVRVSVEAAQAVEALAAATGESKGAAATSAVLAGVEALTRPDASPTVAGIKCDTLERIAGLLYEKRDKSTGTVCYAETVAGYAEKKGMSVEDAVVRLVTVALGREAALMHDRDRVKAGRPARTYRGRVPQQSGPRPVVLGPWDLPGEGEGEGSR